MCGVEAAIIVCGAFLALGSYRPPDIMGSEMPVRHYKRLMLPLEKYQQPFVLCTLQAVCP